MKGWKLALLAALAIAAFAYTGFAIYRNKQDRTAEQLEAARDAARAEGLPTNAEEFREILGRPKGTNAFDVIKEIEALSKSRRESGKKTPGDFERDQFADPQVQREFADYLALFDKAAAADCYVAMRKWEDGLIVFFSDYAELKYVARLAIGRAQASFAAGRTGEALRDAERVKRVVGFLRSERHQLAVVVASGFEVGIASFILERARDLKTSQDVDRAQALLDSLLVPQGIRDSYLGDMVMLLETVRFICEGGVQAAVFYEAAQTAQGVRKAEPFSKSQSDKFQAEALEAYTRFFKEASDDVTDVKKNTDAHVKIAQKLVEWSLFEGFPIEVVKVIEALGGLEDPFEKMFGIAVRGDMFRKAFGIARAGSSTWPQDKSYVAGAYGAKASYQFNRTANGFSLTCEGITDSPIEVHYPKKP